MQQPTRQSKNWVFTCFLHPIGEIQTILEESPTVVYFCMQSEVCPDTDRLHTQGYVVLATKRRFAFLRELLGAHWEVRRGSHIQAREYCRKDDTRAPHTLPIEGGIEPVGAGSRCDLTNVRDIIQAGGTSDDIIEQYPAVFARYPHFVAALVRLRITGLAIAEVAGFIPREGWQATLAERLVHRPDPRKVMWYWEAEGNTGKSHFATNFSPTSTFIATGGKHSDIQYAYKGERVVIFDWPREGIDRVPYSLIEALKNGYYLQTKYESEPFRFPTPHVIVFANREPDWGQLSYDRWDVVEIEQ